jgi:hypothetical protein
MPESPRTRQNIYLDEFGLTSRFPTDGRLKNSNGTSNLVLGTPLRESGCGRRIVLLRADALRRTFALSLLRYDR